MMKTELKNKDGYLFYSSLQQNGIDIEWHELWHEIEVWYGDIQKKESAEEFITRLQKKFSLKTKQP